VKSFPTVGYWLSLVPVLPALREVVGDFCCRVLTEYFGRYRTADRADARDRVDPATLLRFMQVAQEEDPLGRLHRGGLGGVPSFLRGANTGDWGEDTKLEAVPVEGPAVEGDQGVASPPVPTRPATHEVILRNLLQSPVVRQDLGIVRAEPSAIGAARVPVSDVAPPETSPEHLAALAERVTSLERELAELRKPAPRKRTTRPKPTE
jgi:hypothetical protein